MMNRRKALKAAAGIIAGTGAGLLNGSCSGGPDGKPVGEPRKLDYNPADIGWQYAPLDPEVTAQKAYGFYNEGSCMFGTIKSVVSQLEEIFAGKYGSFPMHMFKYGHGGVGGFGSVCGAINGAAALMGLLISVKEVQDHLINDLFQWYEAESFPAFMPLEPVQDYTPVTSVSGSVLCHASNTNWCKTSGFSVSSNERKERCRRLTADVAKKTVAMLNLVNANDYVTGTLANEEAASCITCHGSEGKLKNTSAGMSCNSCHSESAAHKVFADVHYKLMK